MKLAKRLGAEPAGTRRARSPEGLGETPGIASVEVAGPGFINIRLDAAAAGLLAKQIVDAGAAFGTNDTQRGASINLEFVSANPTGPLHIGHTRWAALGDSIGRVLAASGRDDRARVLHQRRRRADGAVRRLGARGAPRRADPRGRLPRRVHPGARRARAPAEPDILTLEGDELLARVTARAYELQLGEIRESLEKFNVHFDVWFSELDLQTPDAAGRSLVDEAVDRLREQGHVYDEEGAVWVRTTDFGDDRDRVIRRANGVYTYFAADAAYYLNKGDRGFRHKIYLLGADHHGYVHRLKALAGAAGDDPDADIEVLIGQLVSINGARLSKRAGNIIELDDLREWLGTDALRYSLARYPADSPLTLDPELLQKRTNDNPVFYVQYAHARTHNVARNAGASGVDRSEFAPGAARARDRVGAARRAAGVPPHGGLRRRGARAAPHRPLPRGAGGAVSPLVRPVPHHPAER